LTGESREKREKGTELHGLQEAKEPSNVTASRGQGKSKELTVRLKTFRNISSIDYGANWESGKKKGGVCWAQSLREECADFRIRKALTHETPKTTARCRTFRHAK